MTAVEDRQGWSISKVTPGPSGTVEVVAAVAAAMAELPAIGKDSTAAPAQGGYAYRGIEAITTNLQTLLAKHKVLTVPSAEILSTVPSPGMNEGWVDVTVRVEWLIVAADGSSFTAVTNGIGRDKTDKGSNKAQTQAYKYLLLPLFCIADRKDDADGDSYEDGRSTGAAGQATVNVSDLLADGELTAADAKAQLVAHLKGNKAAAAQAWRSSGLDGQWKVTAAQLDAAKQAAMDTPQQGAGSDASPVSGPAPDDPATGDGTGLSAPVSSPLPAPGEGSEPPPSGSGPEPRRRDEVSKKEVAALGDVVFLEAATQAPTGKKTAAKRALRYALVYVLTDGAATSLNDLDPAGLLDVHDALQAIKAGAGFTVDFAPDAGVGFDAIGDHPAGAVLWSELNLDWPAAPATVPEGASA